MQRNPVKPEVEQAFIELMALIEKNDIPAQANEMWQTVACKTAAGNTYVFLINLDEQTAAEEKLLNTLSTREDTAIAFLVTMCNNRSLDLPSYSLRRKLIGIDEKNREALLVLKGEGCLVVRTIGSTMPA